MIEAFNLSLRFVLSGTRSRCTSGNQLYRPPSKSSRRKIKARCKNLSRINTFMIVDTFNHEQATGNTYITMVGDSYSRLPVRFKSKKLPVINWLQFSVNPLLYIRNSSSGIQQSAIFDRQNYHFPVGQKERIISRLSLHFPRISISSVFDFQEMTPTSKDSFSSEVVSPTNRRSRLALPELLFARQKLGIQPVTRCRSAARPKYDTSWLASRSAW